MKRPLARTLVLSSFIFLACGNDLAGRDTGGGGSDGAKVPLGKKLIKVIGAEGGEMEIEGAKLTIPPGALARDVELQIAQLSAAAQGGLPPIPSSTGYTSTPIEFQPHGLNFNVPAQVELGHTGGGGTRLSVAKLDDQNDQDWEGVGGANSGNSKSNFSINSFSVYAVFTDPDGDLVPFDTTGGVGGSAPDGTGGGDSGMGGAPGSGGSSSTLAFGKYSTAAYTGYASRLESGSSRVTSFDGDTQNDLPLCVSGSLPADDTGSAFAGMSLSVNEETRGTRQLFTPTQYGVEVTLSSLDSSYFGGYYLFLEDEAGTMWCASLELAGQGTELVSYTSFTQDCMTGGQASYANQPYSKVGIMVMPDPMLQSSFAFCVDGVTEGIEPE